MITLTDPAKEHLIEICHTHGMDAIRLAVKSGGCAGFGYQWDVIRKEDIVEHEETFPLNDTPFLFVLDVLSIMYLAGSTIDYTQDVWGQKLEIKNPNITSSCGCSESFNIL